MAEPSAELVRRAQAGDADALVELITSQQSYVYSIAMGVMRNSADAADATQEVFVRLLRVLPSYRGETKLTTWLYRLATNVCIDALRRRGRPVEPLEPTDDEVDEDPLGRPEARAELAESAAEVRAALDSLPLPQRLSLTMLYFEDMRYEDIAAALGLPLNTVKSHIRRGKERLASLLRRPENGMEPVPCGAT